MHIKLRQHQARCVIGFLPIGFVREGGRQRRGEGVVERGGRERERETHTRKTKEERERKKKEKKEDKNETKRDVRGS